MEIITVEAEKTEQNEFRILPKESHPNYRLWANYSKFARDRGELVADILQSFTPIVNRKILDIGCGDGGTALALSARGAEVTAIDLDLKRVQKLEHAASLLNSNLMVLEGNAEKLYFNDETFEVIILQDVIEHLPNPHLAAKEAARVLKRQGLIYISTPNRWSPFNFVADPHWALPFMSILPRNGVAFFMTRLIRRETRVRRDFAALLSLFKIRRLFQKQSIRLQFVNKKIAEQLFTRPKAVVNSDIHLKVVELIRASKLQDVFCGLVNDEFGFFNYFVNPTWYLIGRKLKSQHKGHQDTLS
ncbi:MAG: methyltransferase domain-containing protein [bacterium]